VLVAEKAGGVARKEGESWGASVARCTEGSFVKGILFKAQTEEEKRELVATIMAALAKTCASAKAFEIARKELAITDLNFL
jgi:hypothetical protein